MKYSYNWLQSYFENPLPPVKKLAEIITFHSLEVEGVEKGRKDSVIEISILPNRSHDCLSYEGMAREIGVLLGENIKQRKITNVPTETVRELSVNIADEKLCRRYVGCVVEGIKIKQSPKWLKDRLVSAGQKSINNIVDVMNFVMLETGQPLHAFDADKLSSEGKGVEINVRKGQAGETLTTLDGKNVTLNENILVIADSVDPLVIAGIKGGKKAEIDEHTKNIVIESANFAPGNIRKTSRDINIRTDSSIRFENELTPEKALLAVEYTLSLLMETAASPRFKVGKPVDIYPRKKASFKTGISVSETNRVLGTSFEESDVTGLLDRFHFEYKKVLPKEEVVRLAPTFVGTPYKLGASISYDAPREFDCSSFVSFLYTEVGLAIPRISVDIYAFTERMSKEDLQEGDILFANSGTGVIYYETMEFLKGTKVPEGVDHCGLYLGNGKVAHATRKSGNVVVEELSQSEGFKNIVGYGRVPGADKERFVVVVPTERLDIRIKEDLIEEMGRIYGYEKIEASVPDLGGFVPSVHKKTYYIEKVREHLVEHGFSEISTYAFVENGDIEMENPLASDKKFLRKDLSGNIMKGLEQNGHNAPLLGLDVVKIFEIGRVFEKEREFVSLGIGVSIPGAMKKKEEVIKNMIFEAETVIGEALRASVIGSTPNPSVLLVDLDALIEKAPMPASYDYSLVPEKEVRYKKISPYPFALRDIAVFVLPEVKEKEVLRIIKKEAGHLLVKSKLFDVFEKTFEDGTKKKSYAFRLVFQSQEKTLSDEDVTEIMTNVTRELNANEGWQVR